MTSAPGATAVGGWAHFTPHLPEVVADPYPAFRWLREHAPAFYVAPEDIWVLSRYDDVVAAARNAAAFSQTEGVGYSRRRNASLSLTANDAPYHTELRRATAPLFSPRAVADHRATAVALLDGLLDQVLAAAGPVNFAETVSNPYLSRLVGGLMGLPADDLPRIKDGATAASLAMAGDTSAPVMEALGDFGRYFSDFVDRRAEQLADGQRPDGLFTNHLFEPCPSGRHLTQPERAAYEGLLATGGNETTAQLLSNLVLLLVEQPGILERLHREPELRPAAVEEVLRYVSPVTGLFRHTTRPVTVAGTTIPADAKVLLMYGSANHDERHYDRPDEFVIDRFPRGFADADHVSFTTGVHVCLGAHLARLLINVFLDRMAERVGAITVVGAVVRSPNALVRVIDQLPVVLVPEGRVTQYVANLVGTRSDPVAWARRREAEGWDGIGVADHLWAGTTTFPHWAVTLGQLAAVTERVRLLSCFASNLLRSPVEYAQAALTLQRASGGRFEAGLGAGWARQETEGSGLRFPPPGERVERYAEAVGIVRSLVTTGSCSHRGRHYEIEVPCLGPAVDVPPPIVVAVGGPRTIREIAPLGDRVELTFNAAVTRRGEHRPDQLAALGRAHLAELIDLAAAAAPAVPRGIFLTVACGDDDVVARLRDTVGLGIAGLAGPPDQVAATIRSLLDDRIDRVQLTPATPDTLDLLAPHLPLGAGA